MFISSFLSSSAANSFIFVFVERMALFSLPNKCIFTLLNMSEIWFFSLDAIDHRMCRDIHSIQVRVSYSFHILRKYFNRRLKKYVLTFHFVNQLRWKIKSKLTVYHSAVRPSYLCLSSRRMSLTLNVSDEKVDSWQWMQFLNGKEWKNTRKYYFLISVRSTGRILCGDWHCMTFGNRITMQKLWMTWPIAQKEKRNEK